MQTAKAVTSMAETLNSINEGVNGLPGKLATALADIINRNVPGVQTAGRVYDRAVNAHEWAARQFVATITG